MPFPPLAPGRRLLLTGLLAAPFAPERAAARAPAATTPLAATPLSRMDLGWWRERHLAKLEELRRVRPALIFLGDSITQSWEYDGPEPWRRFVPVWRRFYGDRDAVNLGFSGDTTANLLWRAGNGEVDGIAPKVAVVLIGANNLGKLHWSAADTLLGMDAILGVLRQRLPAMRVLLLGILPSGRSAWTAETGWTVNRALEAKYARDPVVSFLDVGHVFLRDGRVDTGLYYDTQMKPPRPALHPSPEAQAMMAQAMEPVLARLLGDTPRR